MSNLLKIIVLILTVFTLFHCKNSEQNQFPESLKKLEGKWQLENSATFEIWKNCDSLLLGKVLKIKNLDTTLLEKLRIIKIDNDIFYEATVPSQNDGLPVLFQLIQQEKSEFGFVNMEHDFPKKIIYNLQTKNLLTATISGNDKSISFKYLKIK